MLKLTNFTLMQSIFFLKGDLKIAMLVLWLLCHVTYSTMTKCYVYKANIHKHVIFGDGDSTTELLKKQLWNLNDLHVKQTSSDVTLKHTSPKAPFPIIVNSSKSSTPILCLWSRMYSVSFFSKNFKRLFWSSSDTSPSASFFSRIERLLGIKKKKHETPHSKQHPL